MVFSVESFSLLLLLPGDADPELAGDVRRAARAAMASCARSVLTADETTAARGTAGAAGGESVELRERATSSESIRPTSVGVGW